MSTRVRNPDIEQGKAGKRPDTPRRRSTREQREGQGEGPRTGGPRTAETWYVSRHYDLRTEVLGGAHPKYQSCRVVVSRILRASLEGVHTQ